MVLCAGLGTRLRPLTNWVPKPLIPVGDASQLVQIERHLASHQVTSVVINTHHLAKQFEQHSNLPLPTTICHETEILGTAGGLANARSRLGNGPILLWNGDIFADVDPTPLFDTLAQTDALAVFSIRARDDNRGTIGVDSNNRVARVRSFSTGEHTVRTADYLGICAISPRLLDTLPKQGCLIGDVLGPLLASDRNAIVCVDHHGFFHDVGSLTQYLEANASWLKNRGETYWVHSTASVSTAVRLTNCVIGQHSIVNGAEGLRNCVVWPNSEASAPAENTVFTPHGRVPLEPS